MTEGALRVGERVTELENESRPGSEKAVGSLVSRVRANTDPPTGCNTAAAAVAGAYPR